MSKLKMSTCKYCDAEIDWSERVPYNLDGSRHSCVRKSTKLPEPRDCKYNCKTLLLWDDNRNAFKEVNTGELHTRERCEEAKAKLAQKNNHGNELVQPLRPEANEQAKAPYVDHTAAGIPQIITVVGQTAEEMDDLANSWLKKTHGRIRFKGGQRAKNESGQYEITFYYEELK